jgi:hypothetical protein
MAIGAFMLTARFIWQLVKGLGTIGQGKSSAPSINRVKSLGRALIAAAVTIACLQGTSVVLVIFAGAILCLIWEFSW